MAEVTGLDRATICCSLVDWAHPDRLSPRGGNDGPTGAQGVTTNDLRLAAALLAPVKPTTRGDPESLVR